VERSTPQEPKRRQERRDAQEGDADRRPPPEGKTEEARERLRRDHGGRRRARSEPSDDEPQARCRGERRQESANALTLSWPRQSHGRGRIRGHRTPHERSHGMSTELTLGEAAKAVSRGANTVRDWVKNGNVRAKRNAMGHWLIERDSLLSYAANEGSAEGPRRPRGAEALSHRAPTVGSTVSHGGASNDALVRAQEREIDLLRQLLREERERCKKLEEERTQHLAEMRALLSKDSTGKEGVLSRWIRR
jgi:hypothetical protein